MRATRLAPMSTLQLLDGAYHLSRDGFGLWVRILLPWDAAAGMAFYSLVHLNLRYPGESGTGLLLAVGIVGLLAIRCLAVAALCVAQAARVRGEPVRAWRAWRAVLRRPLSTLLAGSISTAALCCYGLPALLHSWFAWLTVPLAALEGGAPLSAWRAGVALGQPVRAKGLLGTLLLVLFAGVAFVGLALGVQYALDAGRIVLNLGTEGLKEQLVVSNVLFSVALALMALVLIAPVRVAFLTLGYLDARVRKDGMDLQLRLAELRARRSETGIPVRPAV